MYYLKLNAGDTLIEFHNNWLGQETVVVNGQIVSKKSSVMGTHHHFTIMEDGHRAGYILTTKVSQSMQVLIDLRRNGEMLQEDVVVRYGNKKQDAPETKEKNLGLAALEKYDLKDALNHFEKALAFNIKDGEVYFHMACVYSIQERRNDGFEALKQAVTNNLQDQEMILNHDMLAFLRLDPGFEDFLNSGFSSYSMSEGKKE